MESDETAKMLLELLERTEDEGFVKHFIESEMGGHYETTDWLAVLGAVFRLRAGEAKGRILH